MERKTKRKGWFRRNEGRSFLILVDRRDVRTGKNGGEVDQRRWKERGNIVKRKDKGLETDRRRPCV